MRIPSPAIVVATIALVAALSGTAIAGPSAITSALTPKKAKKIATKQARKEIAKRAPGIADKQITKRAAGLAVASAGSATTAATAGDAAALGGQPAASYATDAEVTQKVAELGRVYRGSATPAADNAVDAVTILSVPGLVDFELDCDAGQMFWGFVNRSGSELHFSGTAVRSGVTPAYNSDDVGDGNEFGFVGGNGGGYQATVQATAPDGRLVTVTAFVDVQGPASCHASAQAVIG